MVEKKLLFRRPPQPKPDALVDSLSSTQREIDAAYNRFNFATDPDLIDSCVYEINSLQCRYNYLLHKIKTRDSLCAAPQIELTP